MKKTLTAILALVISASLVAGCSSEADIASRNVSQAADQFEVMRRIVFINGITDKYLLEIEGYCSLGNYDSAARMSVTCKTGPNEYIKHFLGTSDNVTFVSEQLQAVEVDPYHYRIFFRPEQILPDIDLETSGG